MSNKQPCFAQTVMIIAASLTIHPQGLQQNNRHRKAPKDNWTTLQKLLRRPCWFRYKKAFQVISYSLPKPLVIHFNNQWKCPFLGYQGLYRHMFPVFSNKLWLTFDAESLINPPLALRLYPLCVHYISSSLKLHKVFPKKDVRVFLKPKWMPHIIKIVSLSPKMEKSHLYPINH